MIRPPTTPEEADAFNRAVDQARAAAFALPQPELELMALIEALGGR
jgi:hypothetical protein